MSAIAHVHRSGNNELTMSGDRLDLERPRYKQDHFSGRFWHFFDMANPLNIFATNAELQSAVELLQQYK